MTTRNTSTTTTINIELWFIPLDIISLICITLAIIFPLIFLFIIIIDKTCHTVSMLLIANSCLLESIFASIRNGAVVFVLQNDMKQIIYEDSLCVFRAYIADGICATLNYSFLLQALYRYVTVVYPQWLFYQTATCQIILIFITWIIGLAYPLEFMLRNEILYNINNQICQLPLGLSFSLIYMVLCIYVIPVLLVILIYFKLVLYVKKMSKRVTLANTLVRAQRELKMVRRILILVIILIALGFPYTVFIIISFFTTPEKYHFRIALIFLDVSLVFIFVALFQFNDSLKIAVIKIIKRRRRRRRKVLAAIII
ncbi:unnamed protein product [Adineta steineri]|uniref:G-protein coupled receptors family 1 profile domain-containing protein n=1 Tax=Adineta steineri TaxID=433720 RepID=A0A814CEE3_9BILA|nr:unnamed protein product [Adineta steineri]CAF3643365.1 unnamed protein product [Adineta steineri]